MTAGPYHPRTDEAPALADARSPLPMWLGALLIAAVSWGIAWATVKSEMATMRATLDRVDQRVGEIYCGRIPAEQRAGCR